MKKKHGYRVRNWLKYNKALKARGKIWVWVDEESVKEWEAGKIAGKNGRPKEYSDKAIERVSIVRLVLHMPLRAAQGFMESIFEKNGTE